MTSAVRIVDIEPAGTADGYTLVANTTLHRGSMVFKAQLAIELAVHRFPGTNVPLEASMRAGTPETHCRVYWPGTPPTVEEINQALDHLREEPPVAEVNTYPGLPGCLLLRCSDRVGDAMLNLILQADGVERVTYLAGSPYYNEHKTLVVTMEVGQTPRQVSESIDALISV